MFRLASATLLLVAASCISNAHGELPRNSAPTDVAPRLTDVRVSRQTGRLTVEVETTAPAVVHKSKLAKPDRLVFDFPGFQGPTRRIQVENAPVLAVRTAMYQLDPPIARVVIDLSRVVPYGVRPAGNATVISIEIEPSGTGTTSVTPPPSPRTPPKMRRKPHLVITESPARVISLAKVARVNVDENGLLSVQADNCKFIDVLQQIAARSGAQVEPADEQARNALSSYGQQPVTVSIGPATSREVVKNFFQGSPLDYIVIESASGDLQKIIVIANPNVAVPPAQTNIGTTPGAQNDDVTPPSITIVSPVAGAAVSGEVTLTAKAEDNVGIAGVQFNVDGRDLGTEVTSEPYEVIWDTSSVGPGTHVLGATARDRQGNSTVAPTVIVSVGRTD